MPRRFCLRRRLVVTTLAALLTLAVALAPGGTVSAEDAAPTTVEGCLKELQDLVEVAHSIDLLDDQIDHAENYIALMERHCLASEFTQAMGFALEVKKILATNK